MKVLRLVTIGLLAATAASAQAVLDDPQKIADARKLFDSARGSRAECEVIPGVTGFGFSLRLQSGHWRLRVSESKSAGRKWIVTTKVTPQDSPDSFARAVTEITRSIGTNR